MRDPGVEIGKGRARMLPPKQAEAKRKEWAANAKVNDGNRAEALDRPTVRKDAVKRTLGTMKRAPFA